MRIISLSRKRKHLQTPNNATLKNPEFQVLKSSGEKVSFSLEKLRRSLSHSGANKEDIDFILNVVRDELYQGISTREIYNRAYGLLKRKKSVFASKYKLKKAIYELGPTGFPFERFIGQVFKYSGHECEIDIIVQGKCVPHEIDVIAQVDDRQLFIECKFHGEEGRKCDVKIPLYINSRYLDVIHNPENTFRINTEGWVVTNTRFTRDAILYGNCAGLKLMSWDYPEKGSLKSRIDYHNLYPITVSTLLSKKEKQFLLSRQIVLCKQLLNDTYYLDHLGVSETRKKKILNEIKLLCNGN